MRQCANILVVESLSPLECLTNQPRPRTAINTEDKKMNKYDAEIARIMELAAPHLINSEKGFTVANFSGTEDQFEYFASLFQDAVFA